MNTAFTRPWQVIHDPERTFIGPFRWLDLKFTAEMGVWPDGIVFEHRRTGERLVYRAGIFLREQESQLNQEQLQ